MNAPPKAARKVRASKGRVPANYRRRRLQGKCNREIPPFVKKVRVKRQGKSLPAYRRRYGHVNPTRCKITKGINAARGPLSYIA